MSSTLYLSALAACASYSYQLPLYTGEDGLVSWAESVRDGTRGTGPFSYLLSLRNAFAATPGGTPLAAGATAR